jgi:dTDP-4-amino-4,6-dideoxygalactose transaminase
MRSKSRREFLTAAVASAAVFGVKPDLPSFSASPGGVNALAINGGTPLRTAAFPDWPKITDDDEKSWNAVLRKKMWCRLGADPSYVSRFEETWKNMTGARYCVATANGTTALVTSLNALDVGPGDEVLVPPYTFVATINAVLLQHALPIYVDSDRETFQMDADKIEASITDRTRCILPVHLGGYPVDMDKVLAIAQKRQLRVLEDACQAHLAEWRGHKVGTLGDLGCFSFQASKNLNSGEGGAIVSNNEDLTQLCESFHNNGHLMSAVWYRYAINGCNHRMTEFQGALLLEQAKRLEAQSRTRTENAVYLTKLLREIPGITPARTYEGCTGNAYHLYMFRYDESRFAGVPRSRFLEALEAEGIPCAGGYTPLNKEPFMKATLGSRAFKRIYSEKELKEYEERNQCPENDKLCAEAVWFYQTMLLGTRQDMNQIAEAIRKIQRHAGELART